MRVFVKFPLLSRLYSYSYNRQYSSSKYERIIEYDLKNALDSYSDIWFVPFRIRDYMLGKSFSSAPVDIVQYLRDRNGHIVDPNKVTQADINSGRVKTYLIPFRSLFHNGFDALEKKLEKRHIDFNLLSFATESLMTGFLYQKDYHESCLQSVLRTQNEGHISVVMANHLFSRLTANFGRNYFVTNDTKSKLNLQYCPCSKNCGEQIIFDSTGIGTCTQYGQCSEIRNIINECVNKVIK